MPADTNSTKTEGRFNARKIKKWVLSRWKKTCGLHCIGYLEMLSFASLNMVALYSLMHRIAKHHAQVRRRQLVSIERDKRHATECGLNKITVIL